MEPSVTGHTLREGGSPAGHGINYVWLRNDETERYKRNIGYWLFKVLPPMGKVMWWDMHKSSNSRVKKCWLALPMCSHVALGWALHH